MLTLQQTEIMAAYLLKTAWWGQGLCEILFGFWDKCEFIYTHYHLKIQTNLKKELDKKPVAIFSIYGRNGIITKPSFKILP